MSVLKDNRKYQAMSVRDADQLFMRMGHAKAVMEKAEAEWKKKMTEFALQQETELAPLIENFRALEAELAVYMGANPDRFVTPRFHQVANVGKYGFRTDPAHVELANKGKDTVEYALSAGLAGDLLSMKPVPDKEKIAAVIASGQNVAGAALIPAGDVLKYSFLPGYMEQQLKG